jgi:hypothetical protein
VVVSLALASSLLTISTGWQPAAVAFEGAWTSCSATATISGTVQSDVLTGTPGADVIDAGPGSDVIDGLGGDDRICGGPGQDTVTGGPGNDNLAGDEGEDLLDAGTGNDTVTGGEGKDDLKGGPGTDSLDGGLAKDVCTAGETVVSCETVAGDPEPEFSVTVDGPRGVTATLYSHQQIRRHQVHIVTDADASVLARTSQVSMAFDFTVDPGVSFVTS